MYREVAALRGAVSIGGADASRNRKRKRKHARWRDRKKQRTRGSDKRRVPGKRLHAQRRKPAEAPRGKRRFVRVYSNALLFFL